MRDGEGARVRTVFTMLVSVHTVVLYYFLRGQHMLPDGDVALAAHCFRPDGSSHASREFTYLSRYHGVYVVKKLE